MNTIDRAAANKKVVKRLGITAVLMFGFGFAMVPLYGLLCQITGVQSVEQRAEIGTRRTGGGDVDEHRWVTVKFDAATSPRPWPPWSPERPGSLWSTSPTTPTPAPTSTTASPCVSSTRRAACSEK